ncbi:MAG: NAD+ synthase [Calditrichaeota bacterium]|nr:MAG: NAD+ synthase [Calditrichota bacterium]
MLTINTDWVRKALGVFLREEVRKTGFQKVVLGLSGGVDSAVVAALAAEALGKDNVHGLIMPYRGSHPDSRAHAELLAGQLEISFDVVDITAAVDAFFETRPDAGLLRRGNRMARERMCCLYDFAAERHALVLGTSNKTELLLGYGTIFGDLASAINPIGDLYKSQIWMLAKALRIPEAIITKAPSADLWENQKDEDELGYTYEQIDRLLYHLVDERLPDAIITDYGFPETMIKDIKKRIQRNQFKRRPPVIAKISDRTINQDFRYCRDWGM